VDVLTTKAARDRAHELWADIKSDKDPRLESRRKKAELERVAAEAQRGKLSARTAWDAYVAASKSRTKRPWKPLTIRNHTLQASLGGEPRKHRKAKTTPGPLAGLLAMKLAEITQPTVTKWLKQEQSTRPAATRLAYIMLRAFLRWAAKQDEYKGLVDPNAYAHDKVTDAVPPAVARHDCLQREQLAPWFAAVRELRQPATAAYLQCLLLLGCRRTELATLRWAQVDLKARTMKVGGKTGPRDVPVPPYCAALMGALPRKGEFVFVSAKGSKCGHLVDPSRAHDGAYERAGVEHLSLHGLRRTFSTLAEWVDPPSGVIPQIMGHAASATAEKHYKVRSVDFLRMWHDKIEAWFLSEADIAFVPPASAVRLVTKHGQKVAS
jgi:integrase